jgi:hypothetical protein
MPWTKNTSSPRNESEKRKLGQPFTLSAEQLGEVAGGAGVDGVVVKWLGGPSDSQQVLVHSADGYSIQIFGNR